MTGRGAAVDSDEGRVAQLKGKFDHYQRRKPWLGFPLAVFAQLSILGAEIGVVKSRRLWPRSFIRGDLTDADLAAFKYLAGSTQQDENYETI